MSLISVKERTQLNLSDGDINELRATRFFIVRYDVPTDPVVAETETGIPPYFDPHPDDSTRLCKQKRAVVVDENGGSFNWTVQCEYSNRIVNPLTDAWPNLLYEWDFSEASENYFFDYSSTPKQVVNSAGDPFDSIPEREGGTITLNVTTNQATDYDCGTALQYKNYVNSDTFTVDGVSITSWQAKLSGLQISPVQYMNAVYYRTIKAVLKFKLDWHDTFADMGYRQLVSSKLVPIIQANVPVDKPFPLNGSGVAQALGTKAASLTFAPYQTTAFGSFDFLS